MDNLTLYHGTDARLIYMSDAEREDYFALVDRAIDSLWPYLREYNENIPRIINFPDGSKGTSSWRRIESMKQQFINAGNADFYYFISKRISEIALWKNGAERYQYSSFYVTCSRTKARQYARDSFAGGEHGLNAYALILAAEHLKPSGWHPSEEVTKAIRAIKDFADARNRRPVIVSIENARPEDLLLEDGAPADGILKHVISSLSQGEEPKGASFRYLKTVDLKNCKIDSI